MPLVSRIVKGLRGMGDHHHHHHGHGAESTENTMTFEEKAAKLITHWIQHNNEHGQSYLRWAGDFRNQGFSDAADLLDVAEELTRQITSALTKAAGLIPGASND
jgi:hypothetical protein